ncbi:MAG: MauE/DoxX family redox-associated membrane protein, partial [Acidobacteriota bacterium]
MSDAPQRPWLGWIGWAGGAFLGLVLLVAAWAKALDPLAFAEQITKEGLDFLLPALAVALIAIALEVGLGAALLLNLRRRGVLVGAIALVLFFLFLTGRNYWRYANGLIDDEPGCGCFGNLVERSPAEAFWQDLLLMVPALGLAWLGRPTGKLGWWRPALVGVLTVGAAIFAWQSPTLPLDNLATRLKPAVQISDLCAGKEEDDTRVCLDSLVPEL